MSKPSRSTPRRVSSTKNFASFNGCGMSRKKPMAALELGQLLFMKRAAMVNGEKVWAGNDDCRDVTWEECKPQTVSVQWLVPQMNCTDQAFTYLTFQNQTNIVKTEEERCTVEKRTVCERVNRKACSMINFKNCTEVSERKSSVLC